MVALSIIAQGQRIQEIWRDGTWGLTQDWARAGFHFAISTIIGTGWLGGLSSVDAVAATVSGIKKALEVTGRHIADDHYGATIVFRLAEPADKAQVSVPNAFKALSVVGDADDILSLMNQYTAVGISKFVAIPLADNDEDMLQQSQLFIDELLPALAGRYPN